MQYHTKLAADAGMKLASRFRDEARAAAALHPLGHRDMSTRMGGLARLGGSLNSAHELIAEHAPFMKKVRGEPEPPAFTRAFHEYNAGPEERRNQINQAVAKGPYSNPSLSRDVFSSVYGNLLPGKIPGPIPGEEALRAKARKAQLAEMLSTPIVAQRRERPEPAAAPSGGLGSILRRLGIR